MKDITRRKDLVFFFFCWSRMRVGSSFVALVQAIVKNEGKETRDAM